MKYILGIACTVISFAAGLSKTQLYGEYVEARTADVYTGPCFANSEVGLVGDLAVFGWKVEKGAWQGTDLSGLSVVGAVRASYTLSVPGHSPYPVRSVLIVDERANPEQRLALKSFAQRMSGDLLQDIVRIDYQPIRFTVEGDNIHRAAVRLQAGSLVQIATRALAGTDDICHNEGAWYDPLTKLDHAMPAFTLASSFRGKGLDAVWSSPDKRSAFVGTFQYEDGSPVASR
jgi:hypothetical protein